jgi:hypothetical protein
MSQIGALCYSNVFMYHEDLKATIVNHPFYGFLKLLEILQYLICISVILLHQVKR